MFLKFFISELDFNVVNKTFSVVVVADDLVVVVVVVVVVGPLVVVAVQNHTHF